MIDQAQSLKETSICHHSVIEMTPQALSQTLTNQNYSLNKKNIKAYIFDNELLNKFIINKTGNYNVKLEINEYIELFYKNFIN